MGRAGGGVSLPEVLLPGYSLDFVFEQAALVSTSFAEKNHTWANILGRILVLADGHLSGFDALIIVAVSGVTQGECPLSVT